MRITRPRRVVPDHRRLDPLDWDGDLRAARPDAGDGVLAEPGQDLFGRPRLRHVVRDGNLGV